MNATTSPHPEWALQFKKPKTELRRISGHYYLYEVSSVYDKEKKRTRKITGKLLGKITEEQGFIASEKHLLRTHAQQTFSASRLAHREYGLTHFLLHHASDIHAALVRHFPQDANLLFAMAYCRIGWQAPIKQIPFLLSYSALTEVLTIDHYSEKLISTGLRRWGTMRGNAVEYMKEFLRTDDLALIDATDILCKSHFIPLAQKGYNARLDYQPQVSLLYLYSTRQSLPVFFRLLPGNIREISVLKHTLDECGVSDAVVIGDKGFYSQDNVKELKRQHLRFILPLKRNNLAIDYDALADIEGTGQYFQYHKRYIYYHRYVLDEAVYCLFQDGKLKEQEKTDYLNRIKTHPEGYSHQDYLEKRRAFGTIAITTNLMELDAETIYTTYKSRGAIEQMFDWLKNVLDADHSSMQNEEALQGWMFVNHIALQIVARMYQLIHEKKLTSKYSIADLLLHLKNIRQLRINDAWVCAEITNATKQMLKKIQLPVT